MLSFGQKVLVSVSFETSNKLLLISIDNFKSEIVLQKPLNDKDIVVASGSLPENIVLFKNTEKKC